MSDETRILMTNLSRLSGVLNDYVEEDDQITEDDVEALNEAVATIRNAILKLDGMEEWLSYTKAVAEANQERAEEAEQLEIDNEQLKKAFDRACYWLADIQKQLFDIKKEITQLGMVYYVEESIESKPKEEWKRFLLG